MKLLNYVWPSKKDLDDLVATQRRNRETMLKLISDPKQTVLRDVIDATDKAAEFER